MNDIDINIDELKSWIGNDEIVFDEVSKNLEMRFRATLDIDPGDPQKGEIASSGIHWALAPAVVKSSLLGKDSHPQKGGFLPPVALPRRMWAGCQTTFLDTLKIGDQVKKRSSVIDVNLKNGKSGLLCFVKAKYEFYVDKKLVIEELHDIVYRDFDNNQATKVIKNDLPLSNPDFEEVIFAHPTMLFRYSAITFNGHRIHYDYPYSTQVEGYQDLVFHGPLQATLMLRASEKFKNTRAKSFSHKGIAPVFANENLHISIEQSENGNVNCFTSTSAAGMTMKAEAVF